MRSNTHQNQKVASFSYKPRVGLERSNRNDFHGYGDFGGSGRWVALCTQKLRISTLKLEYIFLQTLCQFLAGYQSSIHRYKTHTVVPERFVGLVVANSRLATAGEL